MESNNLLAGDGKRVLFRKNETPRYCKSSLCCVISVSIQIHLFILLPNSCIVVSRLGLVSSLGTPHRETHGWRLSLRQGVLSTTVFFDSKLAIFFFTAFIIKWSRGGAGDVDSPIKMYRYAFKTISWNIETHSELLLSYISCLCQMCNLWQLKKFFIVEF